MFEIIFPAVVGLFFLWLFAGTFCTRRGRERFARLLFSPKAGEQFKSVKDLPPRAGLALKVAGTDAGTKFEVAPVVVNITRKNCLLEAQTLRNKLQAACSMLPNDAYRGVKAASDAAFLLIDCLQHSPDFQLNFPLTESGSDSGEPTQPAGTKETK